jgi:type II secretory pathway component GspD/PulD (secretin)
MLKPARELATFQFVKVRLVVSVLFVASALMFGSSLAAGDEPTANSAAGLLKTPVTNIAATQPAGMPSATILLTALVNQPQKPVQPVAVLQPSAAKQAAIVQEFVAAKYFIATEQLAAITRPASGVAPLSPALSEVLKKVETPVHSETAQSVALIQPVANGQKKEQSTQVAQTVSVEQPVAINQVDATNPSVADKKTELTKRPESIKLTTTAAQSPESGRRETTKALKVAAIPGALVQFVPAGQPAEKSETNVTSETPIRNTTTKKPGMDAQNVAEISFTPAPQIAAAGQQEGTDGPKVTQTEIAPDTSGPTLQPPAVDQKPEEPKVPGLMNLNFFNADIQRVLSALAMQHEINIISSKDVNGPISIHLYRVTLSEALDAVAMASGFAYLMRGDSYYFYKPKAEKDPQSEKLAIRVFKLKYADSWKTEDFEKVKEILSAIPGMRTINIHESSKTIIVEDTPNNLEKIEQVIGFWDTMPKQVMIEARILEVTLNDNMSMGVNWEQLLGDVRIGTGGFSTATLPTAALPIPVIAGTGIFGSLISGVGSTTQFAMAIDALSTNTDVKTLSAPKILAIHGKTARVQVGGKQGYRETVTTAAATTENIKFLDTGTTLSITPYIDEQGNVLLDVSPEISSVTFSGGLPVVTTTSVSTRLLAQNGQTVFIAGLIRSETNDTRNEIPCLGSLPVVGLALGRTVTGAGRRELVVLITPNVVGLDKSLPDQKEAIDKVKKAQKELKHNQPVPQKK